MADILVQSVRAGKRAWRLKLPRPKRGSALILGGGALIGIAALAAILWFGIPACVAARTSPLMFDRLAAIPRKPVAVVLGAAVYPNGVLSPVLRGRVDAAIALYRAGKVSHLLMSGDNRTTFYDEPTAMKRYAVAQGVPPQDVIRDYAGLRTFDTCYRARHVFGLTSAVFVTQAFHLPRTLYIARSMGIDAVGFVAPDNMPAADVKFFTGRERVATIEALVDLAINHKPKFPGPAEPQISANTNPDR